MKNEYYAKSYPWMTADQKECFEFICEIHNGGNHMFGMVQPSGEGLMINSQTFAASTFDFDNLTRAVILAHDRMIRFEICPSGPRLLKLFAHKRHQREGRMHERHPTIEEAIASVRKNHGEVSA